MGKAIITLTIMPTGPDVDMDALARAAEEKISAFTEGGDMRSVIEPLAFGVKSLKITFVSDEEKGSTDGLEAEIRELEAVNSAEVTDVRRAIG